MREFQNIRKWHRERSERRHMSLEKQTAARRKDKTISEILKSPQF